MTTLVFDKTGTVTEGVPQVSKLELVTTELSELELIAVVGTAESCSEHPIAAAIVQYAKNVSDTYFLISVND